MRSSQRSTIETANEVLLLTKDTEAVERFFAPDYVVHIADGTLEDGQDIARRYAEMVNGAFSELKIEVEFLVEKGDRVAWRRTITGIQTGGFRGFPATGRRIVWRDMIVSRFEEGLIAEEWVVTDLAEQLLTARKVDRKRKEA